MMTAAELGAGNNQRIKKPETFDEKKNKESVVKKRL